MCYNVSVKNNIKALREKYKIDAEQVYFKNGFFQVSGFSHPKLPVIAQEHPKEFHIMRWGLIPSWTPNEEKANEFQDMALNAKAETIFEKPMFRKPILSKRCILPVDGFFEWRTINKLKYPYYIYPTDGTLFSMGCINDTWTNKETGEILNSFGIVTTEANSVMAMIHNSKKRMPLILDDEGRHQWIDPKTTKEEIQALMKPSPNEILKYHTVSKVISHRNMDSNYEEIQDEVKYPEIASLVSIR